MSRFSDRVEQDLTHIADRASPSPTAWEAIQTRIAEQADEPETEIIMLDKNLDPPRRITPKTWMLAAAALVVIVGGVAALTRPDDDASVILAADPPTTDLDPDESTVTTAAEPVPGEILQIEIVFVESGIVELEDGRLRNRSTGTFEVVEGADVLGCARGSAEETDLGAEGSPIVMVCEDGTGVGSFTATSDAFTGQSWEISEATGDFVGLEGAGDYSPFEVDDEGNDINVLDGLIRLP